MTSLHLHIKCTPRPVCIKLDFNKTCDITGKRFAASYREHVYNKIPRPYVIAVTQDEQNKIRCFDGFGFSSTQAKEDPKKRTLYKQIYYLCLRSLKEISLIEHAPEDTVLAYAPFAFATVLNKKVKAARQKLIDHYLSSQHPAKALEFMQLNIEEYGEYLQDVKTVLLASKLLINGTADIEKNETVAMEYLELALRMDPKNDEAKKLLDELKNPKKACSQSVTPEPSTEEFLSAQTSPPPAEEKLVKTAFHSPEPAAEKRSESYPATGRTPNAPEAVEKS